jgi:demethylmenaquinone methyltransferase / 2-methoxy-6-polyprenyl-1,4-benzoquinol methylase
MQIDKTQVGELFDSISKRYDFLNHFLTLDIDKIWRRKTVKQLSCPKEKVLDIATGTCDLAIEILKQNKAKSIIGIDLSKGMLEKGQAKIDKLHLNNQITLKQEDCHNLSFEDNSFDAALVGFGVRNFRDLDKGLREINRVLKPGGEFIVLEFSKIKYPIISFFYGIYLNHLLPTIGKAISKHNIAYTYLPQSIGEFPCGQDFLERLNKAGFKDASYKELTFGIVTIYKSIKK